MPRRNSSERKRKSSKPLPARSFMTKDRKSGGGRSKPRLGRRR